MWLKRHEIADLAAVAKTIARCVGAEEGQMIPGAPRDLGMVKHKHVDSETMATLVPFSPVKEPNQRSTVEFWTLGLTVPEKGLKSMFAISRTLVCNAKSKTIHRHQR